VVRKSATSSSIPAAFTTFAVESDLLDQCNQAVQNGCAPPVVHIKI
jgi:hypothetical protein